MLRFPDLDACLTLRSSLIIGAYVATLVVAVTLLAWGVSWAYRRVTSSTEGP